MAKAIQVQELSKQYRLGLTGTGSLAHDINRFWHTIRGKEDPYLKIGESNNRSVKGESQYVWSLQDINFDIEQGDAVGIIGRNGAGKSTLLKILSLVTAPTTGLFKVKGRIASLLEVGTGFHPELTGRENVFLNGAILGMRKSEIARKFDEIVDFSGVERYIDTPVKRYSSGMYVRLAFAVAAYLESEIIIIDEVLAVGDNEFQKKCLGKMNDVRRSEGRTILFVSHNLGAVKQLCDKSILLDYGRLSLYDKTPNVIDYYLEHFNSNSSIYTATPTQDKKISFSKIYPSDLKGEVKDKFLHDEKIYFNFELSFNIPLDKHDYAIFFTVLDSNKNPIFSTESQVISTRKVQVTINSKFLVRGMYSIQSFIHKHNTEKLDILKDGCAFSVIDNGSDMLIFGDFEYGNVFANATWRYTEI